MTIIQGSWELNLNAVPDGGVDLIIVDPPYDTTDLKFDKAGFDHDRLFVHLAEKLKPTGWLFVWYPIELFVHPAKYFKRKFEYIWCKNGGAIPSHNSVRPMPRHEICAAYNSKDLKKPTDLYFDKKAIRTEGEPYTRQHNTVQKITEFNEAHRYYQPDVTKNDGYREGTSLLHYSIKNRVPHWERTAHPTQKPRALYELLINGYCPKDGLVYDPCAGSGTTAVAAHRTGRKYVCIELEVKYYHMMQNRLKRMIV